MKDFDMTSFVDQLSKDFQLGDDRHLRHVDVPSLDIDLSPGGGNERDRQHEDLSMLIYLRYHVGDAEAACSHFDEDLEAGRRTAFGSEDPIFVEALRKARVAKHYRSAGWSAVSDLKEGEGGRLLTKDGLVLRIPHDVIIEEPAGELAVMMPTTYRYRSPGFVLFHSSLGPVQSDEILRYYFAARADTAPEFLHALSSGLEGLEVPYSVKAAHRPTDYERSDAFVLYLAAEEFDRFMPILTAAAGQGHLRPKTSPFAKTLFPGCGIAEEAVEGAMTNQSFGQHRSGLVAEAILRTVETFGRLTPANLLATADSVFVAAQLHLSTPHLSFSWVDEYVTGRTGR